MGERGGEGGVVVEREEQHRGASWRTRIVGSPARAPVAPAQPPRPGAMRQARMAFEADAPQPECSTSLDAKLRFLCSPDAHGGQAGMRIELIETHMSWLVLGPDRVLKLKKPIRRPFLDFTTLAAREWNAREELRLNRRLAAPIYRGLVVLVKRDGSASVKMRRTTVPNWRCSLPVL